MPDTIATAQNRCVCVRLMDIQVQLLNTHKDRLWNTRPPSFLNKHSHRITVRVET